MPDLSTLPRSTSPKAFFETLLPAAFAEASPPDVTSRDPLVVHVCGPGGGAWSLTLEAGKLAVTPGASPGAVLQLSMTTAHFREAVAGVLRDRAVAAAQMTGAAGRSVRLGRLVLPPDRLARVKALSGDIALELRDRDLDDTYRYVITLGGAAPKLDAPKTTVTVDADDLVALVVARVPPQQALLGGRVRMAGDMNLPMQVVGALLGR